MMGAPPNSRVSNLLISGLVLLLAACASGQGPRSERGVLYPMPADPAEARAPHDADPARPAELAESALYLLDAERPGGPDYLGAARMCLLAIEIADPRAERDLIRACYQVAARSALRSGDRDMYIDVVDRWQESARRSERVSGELAIHRSIRARLLGDSGERRLPPELVGLLPRAQEDTR